MSVTDDVLNDEGFKKKTLGRHSTAYHNIWSKLHKILDVFFFSLFCFFIAEIKFISVFCLVCFILKVKKDNRRILLQFQNQMLVVLLLLLEVVKFDGFYFAQQLKALDGLVVHRFFSTTFDKLSSFCFGFRFQFTQSEEDV